MSGSTATSPARRVTTVLLAVALGLAVVPWYLALAKDHHADFDQYWYGGLVERTGGSYTDTAELLRRADADGEFPTRDEVYGPPTLIALAFEPASLVGLHAAAKLYLAGALILTVLALRLVTPRAWPVWFVVVSALPATWFALALGQPSLVTAALLLLAYAWARDGRDTWAGAAVGLATAWKLYPGFVVLAFVAHRRWRAVRAAAVVVAVTAVGAALILGFHDLGAAIGRTIDVGSLTAHAARNESVPGVLVRVTRIDAIGKVVSPLLLAAGAVYIVARPRRDLGATVVVAVLVTLLAQSITWSHYLVVAVLALLVSFEHRRDVRVAVPAAIGAVLLAWPRDLAAAPERTGAPGLFTAQDTLAIVLLLVAVATATSGARSRRPVG